MVCDSRLQDALRFRAVPDFGVAKWADTYRRLSATAAIPGQWDTSRVEVMRGPMNAVTESGVRQITIMSGTQIGKTSVLENVIGYLAHFRPGPILFLLPKEATARQVSKERITPMIYSTPALVRVFGPEQADKSGDGLQYRSFSGGFLAFEGAVSPTNLAARPVKYLFCDEVDKYEMTKEGDPVELAIKRTQTFQDRLIILCCSPTTEGDSRIEKYYLQSDQRRAFVQCPHCSHEQILNFFATEAGAVVNWEKNEEGIEPRHRTSTAALYCESCGAAWDESQRLTILTTKGAVKWRQTRPFTCCGIEQVPLKTRHWVWDEQHEVGLACCTECGAQAVSREHAGFHVSRLYYCQAQTTIRNFAESWIANKDTIATRQVFFNTELAKPFSTEAASVVDPTGLAARRELYLARVPAGVVMLAAGVDRQTGGSVNEGFLTVSIWGVGIGEESWLIAHDVLNGDPFQPQLWRQLDSYLLQEFEYERGRRMRILATCIDSGGGDNPEPVYRFCADRRGRRVFAIKGASDRGGQWAPIWPDSKQELRRTKDSRFKPYIIGVNKGKDYARQQLAITEPGPGYVHFPDWLPEAYFDQLTAEKLRFKPVKQYYLPRGRTNEALDCRVYAYAALQAWKARGYSLENAKADLDRTLAGGSQLGPAAPRSSVRAPGWLDRPAFT